MCQEGIQWNCGRSFRPLWSVRSRGAVSAITRQRLIHRRAFLRRERWRAAEAAGTAGSSGNPPPCLATAFLHNLGSDATWINQLTSRREGLCIVVVEGPVWEIPGIGFQGRGSLEKKLWTEPSAMAMAFWLLADVCVIVRWVFDKGLCSGLGYSLLEYPRIMVLCVELLRLGEWKTAPPSKFNVRVAGLVDVI